MEVPLAVQCFERVLYSLDSNKLGCYVMFPAVESILDRLRIKMVPRNTQVPLETCMLCSVVDTAVVVIVGSGVSQPKECARLKIPLAQNLHTRSSRTIPRRRRQYLQI